MSPRRERRAFVAKEVLPQEATRPSLAKKFLAGMCLNVFIARYIFFDITWTLTIASLRGKSGFKA